MMIYEDGTSMWADMLHGCIAASHALESRDGQCDEMAIGWAGKLCNARNSLIRCDRRNLDMAYLAADVLWNLSCTSDIEMIRTYAPQYNKWAEGNPLAMYGTYGGRWAIDNNLTPDSQTQWNSQLDQALYLLKHKRQTRQCVLSMWEASDLEHAILDDKKNLPCGLHLTLYARHGYLHAVGHYRSNDVWLGVPYDLFTFTAVQRVMADLLDLTPGTYTHMIGSLHLYDKHRLSARQASKELLTRRPLTPARCVTLEANNKSRVALKGGTDSCKFTNAISFYLQLEALGRAAVLNVADADRIMLRLNRNLLQELVALCWTHTIPGFIATPFLSSDLLT